MPTSQDDQGATAVEYALMVAGITAIIAITVGLFGQAVIGLFNTGLGAF